MIASEKGFVEIVQVLLNNRADVNAQDENGNTSLHFATINR